MRSRFRSHLATANEDLPYLRRPTTYRAVRRPSRWSAHSVSSGAGIMLAKASSTSMP